MNWRDNLQKAADLLEMKGHVKGNRYDNESGAMCILGAIEMARYGEIPGPHPESDNSEAVERLFVFVQSRKDYTFVDEGWNSTTPGRLATWNNQPETTPQEVRAALRECALSET